MKVKGTAHNIHKLDRLWMFSYKDNKNTYRVPLFHTNYDEIIDGQEIECKLEMVQGVEVGIPIIEMKSKV